MTISTHLAEQILVRFANVADEHTARFLERLKQLRRLGVPSGVPRGRGVASGRTLEQMLETALAIRLLEAGLASSDVARLVRKEWVLARSVLMLFDPALTGTPWPNGRPTDVYWVAAAAGLAAFRAHTPEDRAQPTLATLMLFEDTRLEDALDEVGREAGWSLIVIRATKVVHDLLAAYAAAGADLPGP